MTKQTLNINEKSGWNALAKETNTKAFVREMGREPHDYAEVKAWVNACIEAAIAASDSEPEKPEPTLGVENGEMYLVTNFWKGEMAI